MIFALRAWALLSWEPMSWRAPDDPVQWPTWTHAATSVHDMGADASEPARGETVWTAKVDHGTLGVAFEWVEWMPGVVILFDPMSICSNIASDDEASVHGSGQRIIKLNRIAHALPWQTRVVETLRQRKAPSASTSTVRQEALAAG